MKINLLSVFALLLSINFFSSCKTAGGNPISTNGDLQEDRGSMSVPSNQLNSSLADVLRKNTSLQVTGTGNDVKVFVRGMSSFKLNTQPLFVIDNVPVGNSYASANNAINPNEIARVRVLRSAAETTTIWGVDGNHGVILIETKSYRKR